MALPVRIPEPREPTADSIFDNQAGVYGRAFGPSEAEGAAAAT